MWAFRLAGAGMAAAVALSAHAAQAEDLSDALVLAYQSNPTLRAERARLRGTDENLSEAWANARPQVNATASYERQDINRTSPFDNIGDLLGGGTGGGIPNVSNGSNLDLDTVTAGVQLEQPLFRGFRTYNQIKQANAEIRAGRAQLAQVEQQVLTKVVAAYTDVRRDEAVLDFNKNSVEVLSRQLDAARTRFQVGEVTRTDVAQAEARVAGARAGLSAAMSQLAASRAAYTQLVGQAPGTLSEPPALPTLPDTLEDAVVFAEDNSPVVRVAQASEEASARAVKVAKGALAPSVSAIASYQYSENTTFAGDSGKVLAFGARATIPLYQGGAEHSRIRKARQAHSRDRLLLVEAQRQARADVVIAWEALDAARQTILSAEQQVKANEVAFDGVTEEAKVGARTTLDVLDAEQELLDARVSLVRAKRDQYVAGFNLLAALGGATAEALNLDVDRYDPEIYKDKAASSWVGFGSVNEQ